MAWLARDKDNTLCIYAGKPERREYIEVFTIDSPELYSYYIKLPSNADEKLIGRHIDWDDEPVKIE